MRGPRLIHLWGPLSYVNEEKNEKTLINLRKAKNDDTDALEVRSIKNSESLLECPTITALVAAFDAKAFDNTELLK